MRLALAGVAMTMMVTTAGADSRREVPAACPTGTKLVELSRRAFPDVKIERNDVVCRVLRARVSTWLLTFAESGCGAAGAGAAAIVQNGAMTWSQPGSGAPGTPCHRDTWQPADLDGDGSDELLVVTEDEGHESSGQRTLTVMAIANGKPAGSDELALASRGSREDANHYTWDCSASYRLVPAPRGAQRIELVGHGYTPDVGCPKDGRHTYAWRRGTLVEQ